MDRAPRPLGFLDPEIAGEFARAFERSGGRIRAGEEVAELRSQPGGASLRLSGGETLNAERVFVALGRTPWVEGLDLSAAGIRVNERGHLEVDANGRTQVPNIFAVGDLVGRPALAAAAMEQGRRAVRSALSLGESDSQSLAPVGIYTVPEIGSVGSSEAEVAECFGEARVGRARFEELARAQISDCESGLLKLVADPEQGRLLGVHVVGEGATELVHLGQVAISAGWQVEELVDHFFNFPTLTEAYRVAALDLLNASARKSD